MSLKDQIAFGKNVMLQKKCDQECNKYKHTLRQSRRRLNALEEDCVTSLYHLLLDAKEGQDNQKATLTPEGKEQSGSDARRAKSAVHGHTPACTSVSDGQQGDIGLYRRPSTAALRNYQISYSFVKDGMEISRIRNGNKSPNRKNDKKAELTKRTANHGLYKLPITNGIEVRINDKTEELHSQKNSDQLSSKETEESDDLKSVAMLSRPQIRNTLKSASIAIPTDSKDVLTISEQSENIRKSMSDLDEVGKVSNFQIRPATVIGHAVGAKTSENNGKLKSHAVFKLTTKGEEDRNNELSDWENDSPISGTDLEITNSPIRISNEETPIVDNEEIQNDQNQSSIGVSGQGKCRRCSSSIARINPKPKSRVNSRPRSRKKSFSSGIDQEQEDLLQHAAEKTQGFLRDYAKKSKLFSYVVNANASTAAPRDRKIYRSPRVTYQELVSIKAGIKKQLLQTRVILQKSARLSSYVNKISSQVTRRVERLEQQYY